MLGADDGIVSVAALLIGVAASSASRSSVLVAGVAGLVAGALSMAAGEYVSVSSQRDTERADVEREQHELARDPEHELDELTHIYRRRGLDDDLARQVAVQLTAADPLRAHLRDELGMTESQAARPMQASVVSALSFASGAALPLLAAAVAPAGARIEGIAAVALVMLAVTGALGGRIGGAPMMRAATRVLIGGAIAMSVAALVGDLVGTTV